MSGRRVNHKVRPLTKTQLDAYRKLSPFVLKDTLIDEAEKAKGTGVPHMINVGRGNPNFLCTVPREASALLETFAIRVSRALLHVDTRHVKDPSLGIYPLPSQATEFNLGAAFVAFVRHSHNPASKFLYSAVEHIHRVVGPPASFDQVVQALCVAILGSFYPEPPRILPFTSKVLNVYLNFVLRHSDGASSAARRRPYDLFTTEGATAGIVYVFKSLRVNGILNHGDTVAIITPIFSPYWELPQLHIFGLKSVYIRGDERENWAIPLDQLDKLRDSAIKCVFAVNPTNPMAVAMTQEHVRRIARIAEDRNKTKHPLLIVADSVYAPFVDEYYSLIEAAPRNTIEIYSFSKYFGVTGWRMGVVAIDPRNIIDSYIIPNLPPREKKALETRYAMTSLHPEKMTFIQRMLNDSRDVAFSHTAGLATPQQLLMCLFAIYDMMHPAYKRHVHALLRQRDDLLYRSLPISRAEGPRETNYYALINILDLARARYGDAAAKKLKRERNPLDFIFRMARAYRTIVLPGMGFLGPNWTFRVSLANSATANYAPIGHYIMKALDDLISI